MGFDQLTPAVGGLVVLARLIERMDRRPHLPAAGLIRLPRGAAERDDRRARLLGERRPLDAGPDVDERAGRRVHLLAVDLEPRPAGLDEVELLFAPVGLVVLVDDPIAGLAARPGVDAEGRDAEVVADGPRGNATVVELLDLVELRNCVIAHEASYGELSVREVIVHQMQTRARL